MTVRELAGQPGFTLISGGGRLDTEITGGYCGDLLSDVMAHAEAGNIWVTMQVHVNIVAVALLKECAAIILVNGRAPADETIARSTAEQMPLLSTPLSAFALCGRLHRLGLGGTM